MTAPIVRTPLKEINRDEAGGGGGASMAERGFPKWCLPNNFIRSYVDMTVKTTKKKKVEKKVGKEEPEG